MQYCRELLEAGVPRDLRDVRGCTALMYACIERSDPRLSSLLCAAGGGGSASQVIPPGMHLLEIIEC
eukprot:SAG31_NODE_2388_length_5808_cov_2.772640_7_plen_67_part_00